MKLRAFAYAMMALDAASSALEIDRCFHQIVEAMGMNSGAVVRVDDGTFEELHIKLPPGYREDIFQDDEAAKVDPVMQHLKHSSRPISWSEQTYIDAGMHAEWLKISAAGQSSGVAVALHLSGGRHLTVGFSSNRAVRGKIIMPMIERAMVTMAAVHLWDALVRLEADTRPKLTAKELQVLHWTRLGKTAWEAGKIIGVSEHMAALYASRAAKKLGVSGKQAAVTAALRLGLIEP